MNNCILLFAMAMCLGCALGCSFTLVSFRYDTEKCECAEHKLLMDQGNSDDIKAELKN